MEEKIETILMMKNDEICMIGSNESPFGIVVFKIDDRLPNPVAKIFSDRKEAYQALDNAIKDSKENGWRLVYRGQPNWG